LSANKEIIGGLLKEIPADDLTMGNFNSLRSFVLGVIAEPMFSDKPLGSNLEEFLSQLGKKVGILEKPRPKRSEKHPFSHKRYLSADPSGIWGSPSKSTLEWKPGNLENIKEEENLEFKETEVIQAGYLQNLKILYSLPEKILADLKEKSKSYKKPEIKEEEVFDKLASELLDLRIAIKNKMEVFEAKKEFKDLLNNLVKQENPLAISFKDFYKSQEMRRSDHPHAKKGLLRTGSFKPVISPHKDAEKEIVVPKNDKPETSPVKSKNRSWFGGAPNLFKSLTQNGEGR
jgi:hypothetical protein